MPLEIFKELERLQNMSMGCVASLVMLNRAIGVLLSEASMCSEEALNTAAYNVGKSLRNVADYLVDFCDSAERLSNCLGDEDE